MATGTTETSLPGSLTQEGRQEDCNLFADIKAADWLGERVGRYDTRRTNYSEQDLRFV